jgi:hypothetical protein
LSDFDVVVPGVAGVVSGVASTTGASSTRSPKAGSVEVTAESFSTAALSASWSSVNGDDRSGRGLELNLVVLVVDLEDGSEDTEVGHDVGADLDLLLQLRGLALALAAVAEHEEHEDGQYRQHANG